MMSVTGQAVFAFFFPQSTVITMYAVQEFPSSRYSVSMHRISFEPLKILLPKNIGGEDIKTARLVALHQFFGNVR